MAKRRAPSVEKRTKLHPDLASLLLFGKQTATKDGWYTQRKYPKLGSKREQAARAALADELREEAPWGHFVGLVAAMIDPRTKGMLPRPQIKFVGRRGKSSNPQVTERRAIEIAAYIHERLPNHKNVHDSIADAAEHFGFVETVIWEAWDKFKLEDKFKIKPGSIWSKYKPKADST